MRLDEDRLRDILEAIEAIAEKIPGGQASYEADEMLRVWCLHHITIIGEAVARLSEDLRSKYPISPWSKIIGMRNILVHGYFDVDWEAVWVVVERELEPLKEAIETVLVSEGWEIPRSK